MKRRVEYSYGENGVYADEVENVITERDPDFTLLPFCTLLKPKHKEGYIPVISSDKATWNYFIDVSGLWWNKEDKSELFLSQYDYKYNVSNYTRKKPLCYEKYCIFNEKADKWEISESIKIECDKENECRLILSKLDEIDSASLRALRTVMIANSLGVDPDPVDVEKLNKYESKAKELRAQYEELQK